MKHLIHLCLILVFGMLIHWSSSAQIVLSEVMTSPDKEGAEYIELYNYSTQPCLLSVYSIVLGSGAHAGLGVDLPEYRLAPHSFIVLSAHPQRLLARYPQLRAEQLLAFELPQLNNQQGSLLIAHGEALYVDKFVYDRASLPHGLRSKLGIAWERLELDQPGEQAHWLPALASAGYATPGRANSIATTPNPQPQPQPLPKPQPQDSTHSSAPQPDQSTASSSEVHSPQELRQWLSLHPEARCQWFIYSLTGLRLHEGSSSAGQHPWLDHLCTQPTSFYSRLNLHDGIYLLECSCYEGEQRSLHCCLKLACP